MGVYLAVVDVDWTSISGPSRLKTDKNHLPRYPSENTKLLDIRNELDNDQCYY